MQDLTVGIESCKVKELTKFLQQEGTGDFFYHKDKVIYCLEIRYSNGNLYDIKGRKESKSTNVQDNKAYKFFLACLKTMRKGEVSIFKIQFETEEDNMYLKSAHAMKFLSAENRAKITEKDVMYFKIKVTDVKRDIDPTDSTSSQDPVRFVEAKVRFGTQCKEHGKRCLDEGDVNTATKIYRKGYGGLAAAAK